MLSFVKCRDVSYCAVRYRKVLFSEEKKSV